ncbi:MAG: DUF1917 domain-containing protein [Methanolinea sp.]|jgi:hypothetical protein|nr:DUF1917 domain-containing protein [Methanolinea sp.]
MSTIDPDTLPDVACGLLFHLLNRELQDQGLFLFSLVENRVDFRAQFLALFQDFCGNYPELGEALLRKYESPDKVYDLICQGEGVMPGKTTTMHWIVQDAPQVHPDAIEDELAGKWLIFLPPEEIDEAWIRVRDATCRNELGISAKVSTARPNPDSRDNRKVIYVYTPDWQDEADVMRVRETLRELGFVDRLGYKRNIETYKGEYSEKGKKVTFYSA